MAWTGRLTPTCISFPSNTQSRFARTICRRASATDYPNLISVAEPVNTIAAEAILASYNWQPGSDRYRRLSLLVESFFTHMSSCKDRRFIQNGRSLRRWLLWRAGPASERRRTGLLVIPPRRRPRHQRHHPKSGCRMMRRCFENSSSGKQIVRRQVTEVHALNIRWPLRSGHWCRQPAGGSRSAGSFGWREFRVTLRPRRYGLVPSGKI